MIGAILAVPCSPALVRNVRRRDLLKSRCQLEAENLFLRHQLSVTLRRGARFLCGGISGRTRRIPDEGGKT
jgi:hypothetical protein